MQKIVSWEFVAVCMNQLFLKELSAGGGAWRAAGHNVPTNFSSELVRKRKSRRSSPLCRTHVNYVVTFCPFAQLFLSILNCLEKFRPYLLEYVLSNIWRIILTGDILSWGHFVRQSHGVVVPWKHLGALWAHLGESKRPVKTLLVDTKSFGPFAFLPFGM